MHLLEAGRKSSRWRRKKQRGEQLSKKKKNSVRGRKRTEYSVHDTSA